VEGHGRVDAAGKHVKSGRVDLVAVFVEIRSDRGDLVTRDRDVGLLDAPRGDDRPAADDHSISRNRPSTSIATATSDVCTNSAGLWLTPPLHRTNSMPTSVIEAMTTASWPAALVSSRGRCPA